MLGTAAEDGPLEDSGFGRVVAVLEDSGFGRVVAVLEDSGFGRVVVGVGVLVASLRLLGEHVDEGGGVVRGSELAAGLAAEPAADAALK